MLAKPFQKLSRNGCLLATCGFPSGCLTMIGLPVVFFAGRSANLDNIARSLIDVFCPCCQGTSTPMCDPTDADFPPLWCFPEFFLQTAPSSRVLSNRRPKRRPCVRVRAGQTFGASGRGAGVRLGGSEGATPLRRRLRRGIFFQGATGGWKRAVNRGIFHGCEDQLLCQA